ncbi:MAG TPA: protein-disulfide reductase DsbD domain-containing protein, partial [Rhizomicrobium sp.]|nr:protein-disulfide reductase DsbD domain-containing protein [Rhizomicrobium sp.]
IIRPGWHTYWQFAGDVGQPTTLDWSLPHGWKASALQWPYPKRLPVGPFMDYGYQGKVWILSTVTAPSDVKPGDVVSLKAKASWLVCKEVCVPEDAELSVPVTIGTPSLSSNAALFAAARVKLPAPSPWAVRYRLGDSLDLYVAAKPLTEAHPVRAEFFPLGDGVVIGPAPQTMGFAQDGLVLRMTPGNALAKKGGALEGVLVLTSADGSVQALTVAALSGPVPDASFEGGGSDIGLATALLLALLGGLILNLMPCVLPVLAMKAFALSTLSGRDHVEAVRESLSYGAGAVLSFLALGGLLVALRSGGAAIGWGFQLQEPLVVALFALLMFGVGLNLSGVFEVAGFGGGDSLTRAGGVAGSFATGVLAVAVAAPCTAPFMAAALGYALTQPPASAFAIFFALGLGFAAPFVLIGISPALMRALPKPGPWMTYFKQALAFAMYGTAAWLVWVLAQQSGPDAVAAALAAMIAAGFGAWVWGLSRTSSPRGRGIGALVTLIAIVAALSCLYLLKSAPVQAASLNATGIPSQAYSAARLADLRRENRAVFVNATAAWCITCLVNDEAALSGARVRQAFADRHITYLIADWTRRDPAITELLSVHGRSGVPLYLYYAPGATTAKVLPQILTEGEVLAALDGS